MLSSITDVATTRTYGGLNADESAGAATVQQIEAAILAGQQKMKRTIGSDVYAAVRDYTDAELAVQANADKQEAFRIAESYFAMAQLPLMLKSAQLGANGFVEAVTMGTGAGPPTTKFANVKESGEASAAWLKLAYSALSVYIEAQALDTSGDEEDIAVTSEDGSFMMMAL